MAQGNFLQSLFNRQPQMTPMIRPEELQAFQAQQAKIAEQQAQPTLMNGLNNFMQDPTSALFGKQASEQPYMPALPEKYDPQDYANLEKQGLLPSQLGIVEQPLQISSNPRTGGLLNDIASGFRENASTPFAVSNLEPQQNKGFATRLGEGLGSAARFADSPLGRMALTAGVVGATGGSGLQALTYGATAGVGNQNLRTQDQFYRNQLQSEGVDTSNIQGYVTPEMYKNQSLGKYRVESLRVRNQIAQQTDNTKRAKMIIDGFTNNIFSEAEAIEEAKKYGMTIDDLKASNQTRNADVNEKLSGPRANYYNNAVALGQGRLGLEQQKEAFKEGTYGNVLPSKMPAGSATDLSATQLGIDQMKTLKSDIGKLSPRLMTPGVAQATALNPWDTDAQAFQQYVNTYKQIIGKGLEGGVLRKEDELKYQKIIPKVGDTKAVLEKKTDQLQNMLQNKYNQDLKSLGQAGYYTGGFTGGGNLQPFVPNANLTPIPRNAMGNVKPRQTSKPKTPTKGAKEKTYYF